MEVNDKIYKTVGAKLGLHPDVVEKIAKSQFEFITERFEEGLHKPIRLQYLGVFRCKPERLKRLGLITTNDEI